MIEMFLLVQHTFEFQQLFQGFINKSIFIKNILQQCQINRDHYKLQNRRLFIKY